MKILYVNGFKRNLKSSSTYLFLKDNIKNNEVVECNWACENKKIDIKKIYECIKKEDPDIIVASSTGGIIVLQLNIPQILINPVIDRNDLEQLFPDCDFSNLPEKASKQENQIVIIGNNDKILNPNKTIEYFKYKKIVRVDDEHQLKQKNIILDEVDNLVEFIENMSYIL